MADANHTILVSTTWKFRDRECALDHLNAAISVCGATCSFDQHGYLLIRCSYSHRDMAIKAIVSALENYVEGELRKLYSSSADPFEEPNVYEDQDMQMFTPERYYNTADRIMEYEERQRDSEPSKSLIEHEIWSDKWTPNGPRDVNLDLFSEACLRDLSNQSKCRIEWETGDIKIRGDSKSSIAHVVQALENIQKRSAYLESYQTELDFCLDEGLESRTLRLSLLRTILDDSAHLQDSQAQLHELIPVKWDNFSRQYRSLLPRTSIVRLHSDSHSRFQTSDYLSDSILPQVSQNEGPNVRSENKTTSISPLELSHLGESTTYLELLSAQTGSPVVHGPVFERILPPESSRPKESASCLELLSAETEFMKIHGPSNDIPNDEKVYKKTKMTVKSRSRQHICGDLEMRTPNSLPSIRISPDHEARLKTNQYHSLDFQERVTRPTSVLPHEEPGTGRQQHLFDQQTKSELPSSSRQNASPQSLESQPFDREQIKVPLAASVTYQQQLKPISELTDALTAMIHAAFSTSSPTNGSVPYLTMHVVKLFLQGKFLNDKFKFVKGRPGSVLNPSDWPFLFSSTDQAKTSSLATKALTSSWDELCSLIDFTFPNKRRAFRQQTGGWTTHYEILCTHDKTGTEVVVTLKRDGSKSVQTSCQKLGAAKVHLPGRNFDLCFTIGATNPQNFTEGNTFSSLENSVSLGSFKDAHGVCTDCIEGNQEGFRVRTIKQIKACSYRSNADLDIFMVLTQSRRLKVKYTVGGFRADCSDNPSTYESEWFEAELYSETAQSYLHSARRRIPLRMALSDLSPIEESVSKLLEGGKFVTAALSNSGDAPLIWHMFLDSKV